MSEEVAEVRETTTGNADTQQHSCGEILKSSVLIGGSTLLATGIGVLRTKALAVMLGPGGFALFGMYASIVDLALVVASIGIGSSAVRQIAESVASGDAVRIARTVTVLRRTTVVLGILGAALVVALSGLLSTVTFGSDAHSGAIALLALAVLFRLLSTGQTALIQGMRRIRDLAAMGLLTALLGSLANVLLVFFVGEQGVATSLVAASAMGLALSWWYSHKVRISRPTLSRAEERGEALSLLKLGFAFMASGVVTMGAAYIVRTIVLRVHGLDAAGVYAAAWTLGGLYVGIILQAMGADFYPRLVAVAQDNRSCNRLVNEQIHVGLLLAGPGVIATLALAPWVIALFYSAAFAPAVDVLRWICLGIACRAIFWPMGFIVVAQNRKAVFLAIDFAWSCANVGLTWLLVSSYGVNGAGMAFFGAYVIHGLIIYPIARQVSGFRFDTACRQTVLRFLVLTGVAFCGFYVLPAVLASALGCAVALASAFFSLRALATLVAPSSIPGPILRVLRLARAVQ